MSDQLRKNLIRLAHANPSIRKDVLPLLTKQASNVVSFAIAKGSRTSKGVEVTLFLKSPTIIKKDWGMNIPQMTPSLAAAGEEQMRLAGNFIDAIVKASNTAPNVWGFMFNEAKRSDNGNGSALAQMDGDGLYVSSKPRFHLIGKANRLYPMDDLKDFNKAVMDLANIWF